MTPCSRFERCRALTLVNAHRTLSGGYPKLTSTSTALWFALQPDPETLCAVLAERDTKAGEKARGPVPPPAYMIKGSLRTGAACC
jgi:hypothetical protein